MVKLIKDELDDRVERRMLIRKWNNRDWVVWNRRWS
jgi:hypothetical protein